MELKEFIKIIKAKYKLIFAIAVLTGVSAYIFSAAQSKQYETSLSLFVIKSETQDTSDFKYDGYYALQAAESISSSMEQWLKDPETVNTIYQKAQLGTDFGDLKSYAKKFKAKKMSSQHIEVKFKTESEKEAEKISSAILEITDAKLKTMKTESKDEVSFALEKTNPLIIENRPDAIINLIIGLISGLFLGIFVVLLKEYFSAS